MKINRRNRRIFGVLIIVLLIGILFAMGPVIRMWAFRPTESTPSVFQQIPVSFFVAILTLVAIVLLVKVPFFVRETREADYERRERIRAIVKKYLALFGVNQSVLLWAFAISWPFLTLVLARLGSTHQSGFSGNAITAIMFLPGLFALQFLPDSMDRPIMSEIFRRVRLAVAYVFGTFAAYFFLIIILQR
jgi:hypothetical protein